MFVKKIPIEEALINAYLEECSSVTPSEGSDAIEAPMFQKNRSQRSHPLDAQDIRSKKEKLRRRTRSRKNE